MSRKSIPTNGVETPNWRCLLLCFAAIIGLEVFYLSEAVFAVERLPELSLPYLIRSGVLLAATAVGVWGFVYGRSPKFQISQSPGPWPERLSTAVVLLGTLACLALFTVFPRLFNVLSREDYPVEWGSALLLFASSFLAAYALFANPLIKAQSPFLKFMLGLLSAVFFIIAMEEISWFQRVIDIKSPESFAGNAQAEMNLHNFATNEIEYIYYFCAFGFLVVLPFLRFAFPSLGRNQFMNLFVPKPYVAVVGAVACAYNYDMWNSVLTQFAFFSSTIMLCFFAANASLRKDRIIVVGAIALLVTSQLVFLINGSNFGRLWTITEYKEFFIPLAFLVYSWDAFINPGPVGLLPAGSSTSGNPQAKYV
ncbi:hypothetical protein [Neolewinella antarctica]|uniref:Uncharacterized protein n=1 Tax=Neolewinella antarctica TaxID=442734 RepID=A0ABX0XBX9_9BACT|nr:hypothetical protein [Neolewinella antarctica]NJC26282.1 hypothetical protein [Neolewinella antarctica]